MLASAIFGGTFWPMPSDTVLQAKLAELATLDERIAYLDDRIAVQSAEAEERRRVMRQQYREAKAARFQGFEWKKALIGGKVLHSLTVAGVAQYDLLQPTGGTTHAVTSFISAAGPLGPVADAEVVLLQWLVGITLLDPARPRQGLEELQVSKRLELIRQLPTALVTRIADECMELQTWLSVLLEDELGNS